MCAFFCIIIMYVVIMISFNTSTAAKFKAELKKVIFTYSLNAYRDSNLHVVFVRTMTYITKNVLSSEEFHELFQTYLPSCV